MNKREFLQSIALAGLSFSASGKGLDTLLERFQRSSAAELASDEEFWNAVRNDYILKTDYINLENGYYCIIPQPTLQAYFERIKYMNEQGSWFMRRDMERAREESRKKLASFCGVDATELIITRNTTESMATVINGLTMSAGDEVIYAEQDYGSMQDMFRQLDKRCGVVGKVISVPNHPKDDEEIVKLYEEQISSKTRLILLSHMINISGQILPVRKICDMAHKKGTKVLVDGAHTLGHLDFKIPELHCDYFASSLHKWLGAPLGTGMLYVRKEKIAALWPLFAESAYAADDIRKLNHTGTYPVHSELSIADAIKYHEMIGSAKKEARLRYLQYYWTSPLRNILKIQINTPSDPKRSCAIANVGIAGMSPAELSKTLLEKYKIWTVAINTDSIKGVRITPGLFTKTSELDKLIAALKALAA